MYLKLFIKKYASYDASSHVCIDYFRQLCVGVVKESYTYLKWLLDTKMAQAIVFYDIKSY